jgi:hypothetical protein
MDGLGAWVLIALLGAYHGVNPAMGWLFAVGLGLQDRDRRAVLRALPPIAVGHELALAASVMLVLVIGVVADAQTLRTVAAAALIGFGLFRFLRPRAHPRWTKMRVSRGELTWWSFLMSSAHGAGLILAPVLIGGGTSEAAAHGGHQHEVSGVEHAELFTMTLAEMALALTLHAGAMLVVMGIVALAVYEKLGVAVLRRAWLNTDHLWAAAFVMAGALTLFT